MQLSSYENIFQENIIFNEAKEYKVKDSKIICLYSKMEAKFFSEIEKNMDVKTIKDFEKEVRKKIYNELESLRKENDDLSRILIAAESDMWKKIRNEEYSWLQINNDKKKKLYRLIDIYSNFIDIVDSVKDLNTKVEMLKQLKETPVDSE